MFTKLAIPFSFITLVLIGLYRADPGNKQLIESYHQSVAKVIESVPVDVGDWVGEKVELPQAATSLLNPNALVARRYTNHERGVYATLLIAQCKDARDMAGHYPPRCYPANGWLESDPRATGITQVGGREMRWYRFHRVVGRNQRDIVVYSMFVLPTGETTVSMSDVRKLSADYEYRLFGAAQIQVVIDGTIDEEDHHWILEEMYSIALPAIESVRDAEPDEDQAEGSER